MLHSHVAAYATLDEIDHCCGERATAVSCDRRGQCVDFVGKINSRTHRDEYTSLHHDALGSHTEALWVEHWLVTQRGWTTTADDFDLEVGAVRGEFGGDVAERK